VKREAKKYVPRVMPDIHRRYLDQRRMMATKQRLDVISSTTKSRSERATTSTSRVWSCQALTAKSLSWSSHVHRAQGTRASRTELVASEGRAGSQPSHFIKSGDAWITSTQQHRTTRHDEWPS
jgi:hypothetical protein